MPNRNRKGRYARTNGNPESKRRPRQRVASLSSNVTADAVTASVRDLIAGRLRRLPQAGAERRQQRAQRLAGDELRDDGVGPYRLVRVGDDVPALPDLV